MAIETLEDFIDNGVKEMPQQGGDASKLSITELKAALYDEILVLNRTQENIRVLEEAKKRKEYELNEAINRG